MTTFDYYDLCYTRQFKIQALFLFLVNITKVEKVGPQSVEIEWSTNDMGRDFKRYSVQIFESDSLSYTDWSGQYNLD